MGVDRSATNNYNKRKGRNEYGKRNQSDSLWQLDIK